MHIRLGLGLARGQSGNAAPPAETYRIEIEASTDDLLLESGDYLLLESAP